jgi:transcriptional regulator with XRE-family HTH domain
MAMTLSAEDVGMALRMWRAGAQLTLREMEDAVNVELRPVGMTVSYGIISRYELNDFPYGRADPIILAAMAAATNRHISELPDEVLSTVHGAEELFKKTRWSPQSKQRSTRVRRTVRKPQVSADKSVDNNRRPKSSQRAA